jgi:adenylate kinase
MFFAYIFQYLPIFAPKSNVMINIVLFGPPGCGKGTQAAKMVEKYHLYHISTGDLFREEKENGTELGLLAKSYADKGSLVPDEVTIKMLQKKMNTITDAKGFIFDGFPRTIPQAEALDTMLGDMNAPVQKMISLRVTDDVLFKRLLSRGLMSGRADDQDESIIRNRINVYNTQTLPVAQHYNAQGKLVEIDGEMSVEGVFEMISETLN